MDSAKRVTHHVVLHRNGDPIHFDVTVDFQKVAEMIGYKAEINRAHASQVLRGAVLVKHIP
jgi:hypothetical protein